ncbi:tubulin-specific chaperone D [Bradysia coprophila]|uniref:tubulin-specific chaperone D n=1 Tax=Bradysia coprophila TaxID=38358 RepID=UPI00187D839A|nr:tubulin-specific chaperone D [Bradysia coprophila]
MDTVDIQDDLPSNTLDHFVEYAEVLQMIESLKTEQSKQYEKSYQTYSTVLSRYQEQPHLLDLHLGELISRLLAIIRSIDCPEELFHIAFKYLYQLSKVRTYKVLVKMLPHEISDLDFVLNKLEEQLINQSDQWETRYMLLLWLSILVLNPFHMSRLDAFTVTDDVVSGNHVGGGEQSKMERIFNLCKTNTAKHDSCAEVASYLASKFLIRIDVKDLYLPKFFDWIIEGSRNETTNVTLGQLAAIAAILKHGKREDLLKHVQTILQWTAGCNFKECNEYLKIKHFLKIVQRLGLVYLKPRLAKWRYQRGSRSLVHNLQETPDATFDLKNDQITTEGDEDDIVVPEEIEEIIEELLQALRSPSSDVRWSAAKGIGRVTNRLPQSLGDEVVGSVIDLLNETEPHEAWHGGCLAIAELAKRGLLLPHRLEVMVPILQQALVYDEMKGYMSVGQHIRDAACYMCWAFARAYDPGDLEPFIQRIACGLLVTTVFDREINCRRAASAAFQESVGRLGNFPHGIDILTAADFFSVGLRTNSFLNISDYIAQYDEYTTSLIDHLFEKKIGHWDTAVREITAKALYKLTKRAPQYMSTHILPSIFGKTTSIDVNLRHGSVLSIGEIVLSLSELEALDPKTKFINESLLVLINGLVSQFYNRGQYRGMSGEMMSQCSCDFIRNCSMAKVEATPECLESWQAIINMCIVKKSLQIREAGIAALGALCDTYYSKDQFVKSNDDLVAYYLKGCENDLEENIRMGYVLALGAFPKFMIRSNFDKIIATLMKQTLTPTLQSSVLAKDNRQTENALTANWAESRRDSIKALGNVIETVGFDENVVTSDVLDKVFECLFLGLQEYTIDDRGDIGAWVRESAMNVLYTLLTICPNDLLKPQIVRNIMLGLAQQAVESIDRTRGLAGNLFCKIVHHDPTIPFIPDHAFLKALFPEDNKSVLWLHADHTFPMFCALLELPTYSEKIVLGLSASIGKLSESLIKYSSTAMFNFLRSHNDHVTRICQEILNIFQQYQLNDRVTFPLMNFLDTLLSSGAVSDVLVDMESNFAEELFRLVKLEIKGQKKLYKLVASVNVLCHLIQIPALCPRVLSILALYLGYSYVHVRKSTAAKLYETILIHGDCSEIPEENIDRILELLSETDWGIEITEIRPIRNELCTLMGVKPPVSIAASKK